jgi:hypothetical protein
MKKPQANRLGMYADVRAILDQALAAGGGSYALASHGAAVHWRQRAYRFRKLFAEILGDGKPSPYDSIVMTRVDADSSTINILIRQITGTFVPSSEPAYLPAVEDDLLDIALGLADKLGD